jgi:GNAT superfamily N-acetyltransferase
LSDSTEVRVRPLVEGDLDEADRIFRVAFGTFLGAPDPEGFFGDADYVRTRWKADPSAAFGAELNGRLIATNFATNWGSVGFFGPLTVEPAYWDQAIGHHLLDSTMDLFTAWKTQHIGLFTFAQSAKHVGLYQKYGFWPRFLTAIMSRPVDSIPYPSSTRVSEVDAKARGDVLEDIDELTNDVYPGLNVTREINAVLTQQLGDTVLIDDSAGLQAVAVCHVGPGTEAGGGTCYIKFGAVRPGPGAERLFNVLIDACHGLAAERGASTIVAGANAGRDNAWRSLADRGFRRDLQGVAMHRPNEAGYSTSDSYVIDDWR